MILKEAERQQKGTVEVCRDYEPKRKIWLMYVEVMLQHNSNSKIRANDLEVTKLVENYD